jgi:predicted DNA-binding WGR domain protein
MPDELRSPIKHHLVLHWINPEQGIRRFYSLMIKRDLFGTIRLVHHWGRIGTNRQELVEVFASERATAKAARGSCPGKTPAGQQSLGRKAPSGYAPCARHAQTDYLARLIAGKRALAERSP